MHSIHDRSELATHLFTLFIRCPFRQAVKKCPFAEIRAIQSLELKFRLAEQMAALPNFSEDVFKTHEACYRNRMRQVIHASRGKSIPGSNRIQCHRTATISP